MKEARPERETPSAEPAGEPAESAATLVELILSEAPPALPARVEGVVIGRIIGFTERGEPVVEIPGAAAPIAARAAAAVSRADLGREVALLFEGGDPARPLIMGLMHEPTPFAAASEPPAAITDPPAEGPSAEVDGKRLTFTAEEEIVLQCGKASITLTREGKILIRGAYVLTRSSGVNRILGGSVQIN